MRKLEEKFRENTTLKYYNENATSFSATTQIVDFPQRRISSLRCYSQMHIF